MMKLRLWLAAAVMLPTAYAYGSTVPGNLAVVTQIDAACTVPSPNGNLTLPFSGFSSLTNQPVSFAAVITSSCTGAASLTRLEFGDGLHATDDSSANPGTSGDASHVHTRRLRGQNLTGEFIGYKIFSDSAATTEIKTSQTGTADCGSVTSGVCNNSIYFENNTSNISVPIYGKIFDETGTYDSQLEINGDIYNDTVQMTVHFD